MAKELYLYSPIYDFVAQEFIEQMEAAKAEDVEVRVNTPGGSVFAGWGMIAKMGEHKGEVKMKVDGLAASMGCYMLLFADKVEALDVSNFMLHRADGPTSTQEDKDFLDMVNSQLRAKLESKIDSKKLKQIKGVTIKSLFEDEDAPDLFFTAQEAKQIGLIDKITKVNPTELKAFNKRMYAIAAVHTPTSIRKPSKTKPMAKVKMNSKLMQEKYPKSCAKLIADAIKAERDRVEACLVFVEIDAKAVKKAIESGKAMSHKQMAEFALKAKSPDALTKIEGEAATIVTTVVKDGEGKELTVAQKDLAEFEGIVRSSVGLKTKK